MAIPQMNRIIERLRRTVLMHDGAGLTDAQLLECFIARQEEAAFEAIVRRHGSMVLSVCLRVLRHIHDAEDAFQATFLVLARKAATIRSREQVANWLYGVAFQTALKAKMAAAKRLARERPMNTMPEPEAVAQECAQDWQPLLDQELSSLPEQYRVPIVLCDLEGKTRKEAARQLGLPEGTLNTRLARARIMLAKRLARHGPTFSGGAIAAILSQNAASAGMPATLLASTVKAASSIAAGKAVAATLVSANVAALTEGVLKAMLITKLKTAMSVVLLLGFLAFGGGLLTQHIAIGQPGKIEKAEAQGKAAQKQDKKEKEVKKPESTKKNSTLDKALQIAKAMEITEDGEKIRLLAGIGAAQARAGDKEGAGKTFRLAFDLVKNVGEKNGVYKAGAFGEIARQQMSAGDLAGARKSLAAVRDLKEKTDEDVVKLNAGFIVAGIEAQIAAAQARAGDAKGAMETAQEIDDLPRRINAYGLIALEQAKRKDFSGAVTTLAQTDSIRRAEMLMDVAKIQEITDKPGAAKTWKLVVDVLAKFEEDDVNPYRGGIKVEPIIRALAERGHSDAVQQWIDGLHSPALQVRLLLNLADRN